MLKISGYYFIFSLTLFIYSCSNYDSRNELEDQIEELKYQISELEDEKYELYYELESLQDKYNDLNENYDVMFSNYLNCQNELSDCERKIMFGW